MRAIQEDSGVFKATVIYPSTQGADGVKLARLLVQQKGMSDLVEVEVPRTAQLYAPVVTPTKVDRYSHGPSSHSAAPRLAAAVSATRPRRDAPKPPRPDRVPRTVRAGRREDVSSGW